MNASRYRIGHPGTKFAIRRQAHGYEYEPVPAAFSSARLAMYNEYEPATRLWTRTLSRDRLRAMTGAHSPMLSTGIRTMASVISRPHRLPKTPVRPLLVLSYG